MTKIKKMLYYLGDLFTIIFRMNRRSRKIFVFGAPFHSNIGDHAQTYCTERWIRKHYSGCKIYVYDTLAISLFQYLLLRFILLRISNNDLIFLHSGYHTTDLYMAEENMQRKVIQTFQNNRIILLPQTILYQSKEEEKKSSKIYNGHKRLTMLCRDDYSYETAQKIFSKVQLLKYPDIVTTLIGDKKYHSKRKGILLCLRKDKEAYYKNTDYNDLMEHLEKIAQVDVTDTTINVPATYIEHHREKVLNEILEQFSHYKIIITDRYHGTIFSLVTNTPVIVLQSSDHKLVSGVKWFPKKEFGDYIAYCEDIKKVPTMVKQFLKKERTYQLPPYFVKYYYESLKEKIESE